VKNEDSSHQESMLGSVYGLHWLVIEKVLWMCFMGLSSSLEKILQKKVHWKRERWRQIWKKSIYLIFHFIFSWFFCIFMGKDMLYIKGQLNTIPFLASLWPRGNAIQVEEPTLSLTTTPAPLFYAYASLIYLFQCLNLEVNLHIDIV